MMTSFSKYKPGFLMFFVILIGCVFSMAVFSVYFLNSILPIFVFVSNSFENSLDKRNLSEILEKNCINEPCDIKNRENGILRFFLVGDWGGQAEYPYTTQIQRNLARGLTKVDADKPADFYISVGDHFYPDGVRTVNDSRFKNTFENAFSAMAHQKLWFLIAGNHDYYKNVQSQLDYTLYSKRWVYPLAYYRYGFLLNGNPWADFIATDSIILCGNTLGTKDEIPPGPSDTGRAEQQWTWINDSLNHSKAPYLFLIGHYPIFSKGRHGPSTGCFRDRVVQLMKKYKVTAYLTGHDHNLQHHVYGFNKTGYQLHSIISGLGSMYDDKQSPDFDSQSRSLFFYPKSRDSDVIKEKGGFVLVSLESDKALFEFYNGDALMLYNCTVKPRWQIAK